MKKYLWIVCATALGLGAPVLASSGFAATALDDEEMDRVTASGQPTVHKGNGDQTLYDNSNYRVRIDEKGQSETYADCLLNVAGENNVACAQNLADTEGGHVNQSNDIEQNNRAVVEQTGTYIERDMSLDRICDHQFPFGSREVVSSDSEYVSGDHVKIGNGEQYIEDNTDYSVLITDQGQQNTVAMSLINVAGRNNVASALNAAHTDVNMFGYSGHVTQANWIVQNN